jgi:hypothetical protein
LQPPSTSSPSSSSPCVHSFAHLQLLDIVKIFDPTFTEFDLVSSLDFGAYTIISLLLHSNLTTTRKMSRRKAAHPILGECHLKHSFCTCFTNHFISYSVISLETLDPVDGTKGFLRNDQYAIALGLVEAGKVARVAPILISRWSWAFLDARASPMRR